MQIAAEHRVSGADKALQWFARPYEFLRECAAEHGDTFTLDLGVHGHYILFSHPDAIRDVFTGDAADLHAGEGNGGVLKPFLGEGSLLVLEEERHLRERRLLLPAFRAESVARHAGLIHRIAHAVSSEWPDDATISVQDAMQRISLDVILRAIFGLPEQEDVAAHPRAAELVTLLRGFVNDPKFNLALIGRLGDELGKSPTWARFRGHLARIRELLAEEIAARRAVPERGGDVLSMLLDARYEDGTAMRDDDLRDELLTLLVTGYETTATALAWAFHFLDRYPEVAVELERTVKASDPAQAIGLPYLDAFVREVLRVRPVIPLVARKAQRDLRIGGRDVPAGWMVAPCIYLTHHRPDLYPDPDRFAPERFLSRRYGPYEYLPFGGGARRCLGMALAMAEMKIVLATVLQRITLRGDPGASYEPRRRSVTVAPSDGARMRVNHRTEPG